MNDHNASPRAVALIKRPLRAVDQQSLREARADGKPKLLHRAAARCFRRTLSPMTDPTPPLTAHGAPRQHHEH